MNRIDRDIAITRLEKIGFIKPLSQMVCERILDHCAVG